MPWPEGSRGEHDAPLPTGEQSRGEHDAPLPTGEQSRGERDAPRTSERTGQHLYIILDDWSWGYSIRKLKLVHRSPHQPNLRPLEQWRLHRLGPRQPKPLPPPFICLEAIRRYPTYFAGVGTRIIATHRRSDCCDAPVPECIMPVVDVRSVGIRFGPGLLGALQPILITVGDDKVFALELGSFRMLSCPPHDWYDWSWCNLPDPPLRSIDLISVVVSSDESTIFTSTECATFAFDIVNSEWKKSSDCSLPFCGTVYYVHALGIFVGLPKGQDTHGYLCSCKTLSGDENVRVSKEFLLSKNLAEGHHGVTLVYLGGSGFCLVECVSIAEGKSANMQLEVCDQLMEMRVAEGARCYDELMLKKNVDEGDGVSGSMHYKYLYRLTTFSLSFDDNEDLTTGETCVVQYYEIPDNVSDMVNTSSPKAFWL